MYHLEDYADVLVLFRGYAETIAAKAQVSAFTAVVLQFFLPFFILRLQVLRQGHRAQTQVSAEPIFLIMCMTCM